MGARLASTAALAVLLLFGAGCPTVDLGDTPTDIGLCNPAGGLDYFTNVIWPDYVRPTDSSKGCTRSGGCHNEAGGNALNFKTQPSPDFGLNYRQAQVFLNCGTPASSQFLTKPLGGQEPHGGSDLFMMSDQQYQLFLDWFN